MFEVGRLVARVVIEGRAAVKADLDSIGGSFEKAAASAKHTAQDSTTAGTAMAGTGTKARAAATDIGAAAKATDAASTASAKAAAAAGKLDAAMAKESSSAGRVRVATQQLAEAREKHVAGSSQVIAAEERLSAAEQAHANAQKGVVTAQAAASAASDKAATATARAAEAVEDAGNASVDAAPKVRRIRDEFSGLSDEGRAAASDVGGSFLKMGAGIAAFVGLSVARFAEFDAAMSGVSAATLAPQSELKRLREAALDAGAVSKYSATEAAKGITELSKAGVQTADILGGGLKGSLDLAAAGQLEVADAAETAATAMVQFNLVGGDVPHIADLLAAGAGKAQGSVGDLGMALKQSGLVASQMGLSIEETTGGLAAFAAAGLVGSDAGTSLKTMLLSLANPSAESAELMKELGINAYDTSGQFVGLEGVAGQLETAFIGKTQAERDSALATIFGSDAIRAANVLYLQGADGVAEWTAKVNDAGYASRVAAELQNNLAGDVEKLGGAFDTALIQSGSAANDVLRDMVQALTEAVSWFGSLPAPVLAAGTGIATAGAAFLLFGGTVLTVASKVGTLRASLLLLNTTMPRTASAAIGMTKALGLIAGLYATVAVLGAIGPTSLEAAAGLEETAKAARSLDGLDDLFGGLKAQDVTDLGSALELVIGDSSSSKAERFGSALNGAFGGSLPDQVRTTNEQFSTLDQSLKALVDGGAADEAAEQFATIQAAAEEQGISVEKLKELFPQYTDALIGTQEPNAGAAEGAKTSAEAYLEQASGVQAAVDQMHALIDAMNAVNDQNQTAIEANVGYQETLASTAEQIAQVNAGAEGYGRTLDITTEAGRSNTGVLLEQAKASQEAAYKQYDLDIKTMGAKAAGDKLKTTLEGGRSTLLQNATDLSGNADEAQAFTDKVYAIPPSKEFELIAETAQAQSNVDTFIRNNDGRTVTIVVNERLGERVARGPGGGGGIVATAADGAVFKSFANGGIENHVAQIAKAGTWRVWAEDETGGETYIPWAQSKRKRSTEILEYTANGFGYDLVPQGSYRAAAGVAFGGLQAAGSRRSGDHPITIPVNGSEFLVGWLRGEIQAGAEIILNEKLRNVSRDIKKVGRRS